VKKLSLINILEEMMPDDDLEAFSAEMEEDGETQVPQRGDVQQVWGGPEISDEDDVNDWKATSGWLYSNYKISPQEMSAWVNQIKTSGFSPEIYQQMQSRVGDMDNFLLDMQEAMPEVYKMMKNQGLKQAIPELPTNPQTKQNLRNAKPLQNPVKVGTPLQLQNALPPNKFAGEEDASEFPELGTDTKNLLRNVKDPAMRQKVAQGMAQNRQRRQQIDNQQAGALQRQQQAAYPTPSGSDAPTNPGKNIRKR
jgi:hypothetical protein